MARETRNSVSRLRHFGNGVLTPIAALCLALVLLVGRCAVTGEMFQSTPAAIAEGYDEYGTFQRVGGVGVLTVWGNPY